MKKRCLCALMALVLFLGGCGRLDMAADALFALDEYYAGQTLAPNEYLRALVWARGNADYDGWRDNCYNAAIEQLATCDGVLSNTKSTAYSAFILTLTAAGFDARDIGGWDLTAALFDEAFVTKQGINGPIFALLALDSGAYPAPDGLRERLVENILARRLSDGGFAFSGDRADPDITAMVLCALAPYAGEETVSAALDEAVDTLSDMQGADGGYASFGTANAESCAQVILALAALGIACGDERFVKNGVGVMDALLCYRLSDGTFAHESGGAFDAMATMQAYAALSAVSASGSLYKLRVD